MPDNTDAVKEKEEAAAAKAAKKKEAGLAADAKQAKAETALAKAEPEWSTALVDPKQKGASLIPVNFTSFKAAFDFCGLMVKTGFLPEAVETGPQAMAIAIYGQELGIPLMTSFRTIHVVNGKPGLAAEMMLTKFMQRGGTVKWGETTDKKCEGVFVSKGTPEGFRSEFTIEKAQKAGLATKQVWKAYPEDMLRARCISRGVRGSDPGAIGGSHSPDELGGDVLIDGTVIDVAPSAPVKTDVDLGAPMKATKGEGPTEQKAPSPEQEPPPPKQEAPESDQEPSQGDKAKEGAPEAQPAAAASGKPGADDPEGLFT